MPERLIKQFKKLDGFNASQDWQNTTRNFLVNKVETDTLAYKTPWNYNVKVFLMNWQEKLVPAPVKAVSFLLLIGLISGTGMAAKASYKPTSMLYSMWEMVQSAELVFATTPTSQTKVYLKHVEKSVSDAKKLANSENIAEKEKSIYINTVVTKLKKDLNSASASLDIADQTKKDEDGISNLAKKVTENTKNTVEGLNQVLEDSNIEGVDKIAVDEAIATTEEVEGGAIKLLLSQQDLEELSDEELKVLLVDKIARSTEKINKILEYINNSAVVLESEAVITNDQENVPAGKAEFNSHSQESDEELVEPDEILINEQEEVLTEEDVVVQTNETDMEQVTALNIEQINELNLVILESLEYLDIANASLEESDLEEVLKNVGKSNNIINKLNEMLAEVLNSKLIEVIELDTNIESNFQVEGAIEILDELDAPTTTETTTNIIKENVDNLEN